MLTKGIGELANRPVVRSFSSPHCCDKPNPREGQQGICSSISNEKKGADLDADMVPQAVCRRRPGAGTSSGQIDLDVTIDIRSVTSCRISMFTVSMVTCVIKV